MATSAKTLATIIESLSKEYKFDYDKALIHLTKDDLLPKKLAPKDTTTLRFASKKAEQLAVEHHITPTGEGSAKNGAWTMKDIEKLMAKPTKEKLLISPTALNLANEHNISFAGRTGSGKDGRILLKDVESWLVADNDNTDDEIDISPRALQEANSLNLTDDDLSKILGTGNDGRILLKDIVNYAKDSDSDDSKSSKKSNKDSKKPAKSTVSLKKPAKSTVSHKKPETDSDTDDE